MNIVRASDLSVDNKDPGVAALRLVTGRHGAKTMTAGIATFEPGAKIVMHTHPCEETVIIVEGEAIAYTEDEEFTLHKYDTTIMPAGTRHCFANKSASPMTIAYFYPIGDAPRYDLE